MQTRKTALSLYIGLGRVPETVHHLVYGQMAFARYPGIADIASWSTLVFIILNEPVSRYKSTDPPHRFRVLQVYRLSSELLKRPIRPCNTLFPTWQHNDFQVSTFRFQLTKLRYYFVMTFVDHNTKDLGYLGPCRACWYQPH